MSAFDALETPCLILDTKITAKNIETMAARCRALGVNLRPHVKTPKSLPIAERLRAQGAQGFTVSTLREAEYLAGAGFDDLFYAVPLDPHKVGRAARLLRDGCRLSCLVDTFNGAQQIAAAAAREGAVLPLWIEVDVDHYRTGVDARSANFDRLVGLIHAHPALALVGLMSYGGASYGCASVQDVAELTERHRLALLAAAERAARLGAGPLKLSFGSTPAVKHATHLEGIDEVRCGIYTFQDLFQAGIGACAISDIALTVLTTVIGHGAGLNRFTIDAGALALSKDRSTQGRAFDAGFGLLCEQSGALIPNLYVAGVSQELGLVTSRDGEAIDLRRYPVGSRLRVLPNHADMTAAAYEEYHLISAGRLDGVWTRANRW